MGTYVYTMRADHVVAAVNGQRVQIHRLSYLYKPSYSAFYPEPKTVKMALARTENYWATHAQPTYFILGSAFEGNETVYRRTRDASIWCDTDKVPGEAVGELVRDGSRSWKVAPHDCIRHTPVWSVTARENGLTVAVCQCPVCHTEQDSALKDDKSKRHLVPEWVRTSWEREEARVIREDEIAHQREVAAVECLSRDADLIGYAG